MEATPLKRADDEAADIDKDTHTDVPCDEKSAVEELIARITENPTTVAWVRALLRDGYSEGLTPGDQSLLEWHIAEETGWSTKVVSQMSKDERNRRDGKYISDIEMAAQSYGDYLERDYASTVWCDGSFWIYPIRPSTTPDEAGTGLDYYSPTTEREIGQDINEYFQATLIARSLNDRKELMARLQARFSAENFFEDASPGLNVANGFLRVNTTSGLPELLQHSVTHKARTLLPANYDRTATATHFMAALEGMLPDRSKREALQEFAGGILFNVRPRSDSSRRIALLHGAAGSGKSTFLRLMERLMDGQSVAVSPQSWANEGSRARLAGASLNVWYELDSGKALVSAWAKQIASCEMISARHPYGREFQFRPVAWHLFSCNELPGIDDTTAAVARRFLLIHFEHALAPSSMDDDFLAKIEAEASGIINWAAEGARRLIETGRFTEPAGQARALLEMQHGDDPLVRFVHEQLERAPGERLLASSLRQSLNAYGVANGIDDWAVIGSGLMKRLSRAMTQVHGSVRGASNSRVEYHGVRLRHPVSAPAGRHSDRSHEVTGRPAGWEPATISHDTADVDLGSM
jgi:putative DNA primase/helicase